MFSWVHDNFTGFSYDANLAEKVYLFMGCLQAHYFTSKVFYNTYMKIQCTIVHKSSMDLLLLSGYTVTSTEGLTATHIVIVQQCFEPLKYRFHFFLEFIAHACLYCSYQKLPSLGLIMDGSVQTFAMQFASQLRLNTIIDKYFTQYKNYHINHSTAP